MTSGLSYGLSLIKSPKNNRKGMDRQTEMGDRRFRSLQVTKLRTGAITILTLLKLEIFSNSWYYTFWFAVNR